MSLTSHLFTTGTTISTVTKHSPSLPRFLKNPPLHDLPRPITTRHVTTNTQSFHLYPSKAQSLTFDPHILKAASQSTPSPQIHEDPAPLDLESLLSAIEFLCLLFAAVVAVGYAVNCTFFGAKRAGFGSVVYAWAVVAGVAAVGIGVWIRWRQWRRVCVHGGVDLLERIERLEHDMRSSVSVVRVLSRKLEKLGIRFRVTRQVLKTPVAETAALAQKNLEMNLALAAQEDILEKELGEVQKVLLAMQEQQEKQLRLILAIGEARNSLGAMREPTQVKDTIRTSDAIERVKDLKTHKSQVSGVSNISSNATP